MKQPWRRNRQGILPLVAFVSSVADHPWPIAAGFHRTPSLGGDLPCLIRACLLGSSFLLFLGEVRNQRSLSKRSFYSSNIFLWPPQAGGCLTSSWMWFQSARTDAWIFKILCVGYHISFLLPRPLIQTPISFPSYELGFSKALALLQEVIKMLEKHILEVIKDITSSFQAPEEGNCQLEANHRSFFLE